MIQHPAYPVEPWSLTETELRLDVLAQSESLFALANGHIGWRGNLDEGEPSGLPGSYLNGVYEPRPLPYAEAGYGYPEAGQTVVNVTNAKLVRLLVDDQPFDVRPIGSSPATLSRYSTTESRPASPRATPLSGRPERCRSRARRPSRAGGNRAGRAPGPLEATRRGGPYHDKGRGLSQDANEALAGAAQAV